MRTWIRLVQNENLKLYHKRSTLLNIGFYILFLIVAALLLHTQNQTPLNTDWKSNLAHQNVSLKNERSQPNANLQYINDSLALNTYELKHNINPYEQNTASSFSVSFSGLALMIFVFGTMTAGSVVSSEFNTGTVKLWLTRPVNRWVLLLSKYLSQLLFLLGLTLAMFIISFIFSLIFYGNSGWGTPVVFVHHAMVYTQTAFSHLLAIYGLHFIEALVVMTLAFMLSTLTHNSAFSIGITLFLTLTKTITTLLESQYHWLKYYLFNNLDLNRVIWQTPSYTGHIIGPAFSLTIVFVYFVLFLIVAWVSFAKRDVTNS